MMIKNANHNFNGNQPFPKNDDEWIEVFNQQSLELKTKLAKMNPQERVQYMLGFWRDCKNCYVQ